jgi:putative transposase
VGKKSGANPTDRAKSGTKRSVLTEGGGIPLGVAVAGANVNDFKLVEQTLKSIPVDRPQAALPEAKPGQPGQPGQEAEQGLCLDAGYDYDEVRELAQEFGYTTHIQSRSEEAQALKRETGYKARRWVVERTHSWMNRFRGILIRWNKKPQNYLSLLHLVCAIITYRSAGLLG